MQRRRSHSATSVVDINVYRESVITLVPAVAAPTFSPNPATTYTSAQTVTISSATSGATICYTTDGSTTPAATTPGTCSTGSTYAPGFSVPATTTIRALATKVGMTNSSVQSATYTITTGAAPAFVKEVQKWSYTDNAASETFNFAQSVAAGHLLVIHYDNGSNFLNGIASVTATGCGSTWTVVKDPNTGDVGQGVAYTICTNGATTANSITLNWTTANYNYKWGDLEEYSGIQSTNFVDGSVVWTAPDYTASAVSMPITTTNANDAISCKVFTHAAYTVAGGFTQSGTQSLNGIHYYAHRIVSSAGTYNPAGTVASAEDYFGACIAFKGQ